VIEVPFNFIPKGTIEYNINGGALKTGNHDAFSESSLSWGVTQSFTLGSELIYLNEPGLKKFYPNANLSFRVSDNFVFSNSYFHELKNVTSLSVLLPSQIFSTLSYIKYQNNNYFNPLNYTDEQNITTYIPLTFKNFSTSFRINARNVTSDSYKYIFLNSGFFTNYKRIQGSIITNGTWTKTTDNYQQESFYSYVSVSYRLLSDLLLRQETDIDHTAGKISNAGLYIDKSIFKSGWLTAFIFRDFNQKNYSGGINFRYDFSFGRYSSGYSASKSDRDFQQSIFGSVGFDEFKKKFILDNQNMVSRGGLTLVPFLDLNNNNKLDENEKILETEFRTKMVAGKVIKSENSRDYHYVDLEPYDTFRLDVEPVSFDNPLCRPRFKSYSITVDPNQFKYVPIPVYVSGIISGNVLIKDSQNKNGIPGMKIILESIDGKSKIEKITFSDGEYIFDNIPPGKYKLYPAPEELVKRNLSYEPEYQIIEIKNLEEGDSHEDVDISLVKNIQ
jgi:hypothetical protein